MARVTVDFSDVQEFEPMGKGEYDVLVEKVEYREAQQEDKYPYLNWELTVTENGFENRKLWFITSFSPKALFRMKDIFENLGLPSDEVEIDYDEESSLIIEPSLAGLPARAVVSVRMYEGRPQDNVDTLLPIDAPRRGDKAGPVRSPSRAGGAKKTGGARKKTGGAKKSSTSQRKFK